ncbi:TLD-domain-containing protein [Mycotypha africana]|uniref:TLD-domain-containing protein n=1 Tax=Mycotypha africana TaxID=64632 RepID=UPI002301DCEF|nr:TLD-domain-containing protein [Mycotypha africana]KAI8987751.1 TLD-domain-containing protein [Mycotypha africana]
MSTSMKLTGRREDTDIVLTEQIASALKAELPRRYRLAPEMTLLYSIDQHGISLHSLYRLAKNNKGPCVLSIKDANNNIFGAFLNETLKPGTRYYGTGESFLWKWSKAESKLITYKWTGKNDYIILSDMEFIAVGGGEGVFGLWINSELEKGYSQTCPTFDNEQLSKNPEFECVELEIWGFKFEVGNAQSVPSNENEESKLSGEQFKKCSKY